MTAKKVKSWISGNSGRRAQRTRKAGTWCHERFSIVPLDAPMRRNVIHRIDRDDRNGHAAIIARRGPASGVC